MSRTFHIPTPCHENWEGMTPAAQGRHCAACCQTVIDFSGWEADAIAAYLKTHQNTNVCGRMRAAQVTPIIPTPEDFVTQIMQAGISFLRKVAAVMVFVCCITGVASAQQPLPKEDTTRPVIMGKIAAPQHPPLRTVRPVRHPKKEQHITGLIAPAPYPTVPVKK